MAAGCGGGRRSAFAGDGLDTLYAPRHATGFAILRGGESSTVISIADPWQGAEGVGMHLFVSRDGERPPAGFDGTAIAAPLRRVVCMSSSHVAFIDALGRANAVVGVSGVRYIHNAKVRQHAREVGYDTQMNYELLAALRPDLVLVYGIAGENSQLTGKLRELGIPYFYVGEYVEQSPLGRAEWLVALGEMFDRREVAERVFDDVARGYDRVRETVTATSARPRVMLNAPYRDVWYMPARGSYMVRLIEDAGGEYIGTDDEGDRSLPVSSEAAYVLSRDADVWLNPGQATSMHDVLEANPRFGDIAAVRSGRVWNCNARMTADGGSDFWESGAVRPDVVLRDLAAILHPELSSVGELYYFRQMR
jgi:iron complex transport system substrate-binding protein